jgi:hypothetical protein
VDGKSNTNYEFFLLGRRNDVNSGFFGRNIEKIVMQEFSWRKIGWKFPLFFFCDEAPLGVFCD